MELACEKCSHSKVCGRKDRINETIKTLTLDKLYQDLIKHDIVIKAHCPHFDPPRQYDRSDKQC